MTAVVGIILAIILFLLFIGVDIKHILMISILLYVKKSSYKNLPAKIVKFNGGSRRTFAITKNYDGANVKINKYYDTFTNNLKKRGWIDLSNKSKKESVSYIDYIESWDWAKYSETSRRVSQECKKNYIINT